MTTKANWVMKSNVEALLEGRGETREALSIWCRREVSWAAKILGDSKRWFPMKHWDRISDFFGVSTYQLLQPGISMLTERRKRERRSGVERRLRNAALVAHESPLNDRSLVQEVLNLGPKDRVALIEHLALLKRRRIDVPSTTEFGSGRMTSEAPSEPFQHEPKKPMKRR